MPNTKISQLPAAVALTGTEIIPAVQGAGDVGVRTGDIATINTGLSNWVPLGNAGATMTLVGDTTTGAWSDLGNIGATVTLTG